MLQDGFNRRRNGQDVDWLYANTAAGRRASGRGEERGVGSSSIRVLEAPPRAWARAAPAPPSLPLPTLQGSSTKGWQDSEAPFPRALPPAPPSPEHALVVRVAMEMIQEGMPASCSVGRGCKGGGGWGAGGAAGWRLMGGARGLIVNGDSVEAASLETELQARIVVLAARGVDTSNDEELVRELRAMLDQEYEEELSLCL